MVKLKPELSHATRTVFGIARDLPLNYVERKSADAKLVDSLTRDKHIVIYGSSKQGKTSLRKNCLQDSDYVVIQCSNKWQLKDLHTSILKEAGYEITESTKKSTSGTAKVVAKAKAGIMGFGGEASGEVSGEHKSETTFAPLELESEDANDIIRALNAIGFTKYLVLEDFHYLPIETQKDFAVALKAYHERSKLNFIIIGVWLEENRLTVYNGDLTGRVIAIDADAWTDEELSQVIEAGEQLLNLEFNQQFKERLLAAAFSSVYIVQEVCYECCQSNGILKTLEECRVIGDPKQVDELVKAVVDQQSGRFNSFLTQFAEGFQTTELEMHRWILYPIIVSDVEVLENGLRFGEIKKVIQSAHPRKSDLNPGNVTQALQACASLQVKKEIKPIILDYDQTNSRLNVVDKSFFIWLENQDRKHLLEMSGLPPDQVEAAQPPLDGLT